MIFGTPEEVIGSSSSTSSAGSRTSATVPRSACAMRRARRSLELFIREVMPAFHVDGSEQVRVNAVEDKGAGAAMNDADGCRSSAVRACFRSRRQVLKGAGGAAAGWALLAFPGCRQSAGQVCWPEGGVRELGRHLPGGVEEGLLRLVRRQDRRHRDPGRPGRLRQAAHHDPERRADLGRGRCHHRLSLQCRKGQSVREDRHIDRRHQEDAGEVRARVWHRQYRVVLQHRLQQGRFPGRQASKDLGRVPRHGEISRPTRVARPRQSDARDRAACRRRYLSTSSIRSTSIAR